MKETISTKNRAETLKQQFPGTAPVLVDRVLHFRDPLPPGQLNKQSSTGLIAATQAAQKLELYCPVHCHSGSSEGYDQCPELVGAGVTVRNLVRISHRPYSGALFEESTCGGGT